MAKKTKTGCFESVYPVFIYCQRYTELIEIWTKRLGKENGMTYDCAMIFPFIAHLRYFSPPSRKHRGEWRLALDLRCTIWTLGRKEAVLWKTRANHGHEEIKQEHFKDQHEHWGCLLSIFCPRVLVFAPIIMLLEWPLWKMNSNGKATNRLETICFPFYYPSRV